MFLFSYYSGKILPDCIFQKQIFENLSIFADESLIAFLQISVYWLSASGVVLP